MPNLGLSGLTFHTALLPLNAYISTREKKIQLRLVRQFMKRSCIAIQWGRQHLGV